MAKHSLTSSKLSATALFAEEEDPMSSMGNLMDVMLVFVCGLLLALIATWGVDITSVAASIDDSTIEPVEGDLTEVQRGISSDDSNYTELGIVYLEESTGQLYVVTPSDE